MVCCMFVSRQLLKFHLRFETVLHGAYRNMRHFAASFGRWIDPTGAESTKKSNLFKTAIS